MDEKIANLIKIKDDFNETMMKKFLESYKNKLYEMSPKNRRKKNQGGGVGNGLRRRRQPAAAAAAAAALADDSDDSDADAAAAAAADGRLPQEFINQVEERAARQARHRARQSLLGQQHTRTQEQIESMALALSELTRLVESEHSQTHSALAEVAQTLASIDKSTQDAEQQRDNLKEQADKHYKNIMNGINDIKTGIKDDAHCIEDTSKNGLILGLVMGNLFRYYYQDSPSDNTGMSLYRGATSTNMSLYNQPQINGNMKKAAVNIVSASVLGGMMGYFYKCILLLLKILRKILSFILNTYISINLFLYYLGSLWGETWNMVFLSSTVKGVLLIVQICINFWLWIFLFKMFGFDNIITTISTKIIKPIINFIYYYIKDIPSEIKSSIGSFIKPISDMLDAFVPDGACEGAPEVGDGRFMFCCINVITSFIASMVNSICCAGGNRYLNPLLWCCKPSEEMPAPPPAPPGDSWWSYSSSNGAGNQPPKSGWFGGSYKKSKSNMNDDDFDKYVTIILSSKLIIKNKKDIENIQNNIIKFLDLLVKFLGFLNFIANVLVKAIKMREKQLKLLKSPNATLSRKKRITYGRIPIKAKTGSKKTLKGPIKRRRGSRKARKGSRKARKGSRKPRMTSIKS